MRTLTRTGGALCLLLAGCVSSTPPADFYTLTPEVEESERGSVAIEPDTVGFGPIELPRYLHRPQMVTRAEGNRLVIDEFARWGDALDLQFGRTVTQNLTRLCKDTLVLPFPFRADFEPDLRVLADVTRFEADDTGAVILEMLWAVTSLRPQRTYSIHESTYRGSADASDPASVARGMSEVLAQFSREAAAALSEAGMEQAAGRAAEADEDG